VKGENSENASKFQQISPRERLLTNELQKFPDFTIDMRIEPVFTTIAAIVGHQESIVEFAQSLS
jgi:hypothetical protein